MLSHNTIVTIDGDQFCVNGKPTYPGRVWEGRSLEGLLLNSRMVQATFDDENPATRHLWAYPDAGAWDAERNTSEFVAAMAEWRAHGLLCVTVNLQGGGPIYGKPFPYDQYLNSAYTPTGALKPAHTARLQRVLERADELGMVVILGLAYFGVDHRFIEHPEAARRMTDNVVDWLAQGGYRHVLIEIANERTHMATRQGNVGAMELIARMRSRAQHRFPDGWTLPLATAHGGGGALPSVELLRVEDLALLHGNRQTPQRHRAMIEETRRRLKEARGDERALPLVFNEAGPWDEYDRLEQWMDAFKECVRHGASWGYFSQGEGRVENGKRVGTLYESGYQTPPVNWGINTEEKRLFFRTLKEMTGH